MKATTPKTEHLETRILSELLILDVLSRLGEARIPRLVSCLRQATENSRVPFFLGTDVREVLSERERTRHVQRSAEGTDWFYKITPLGRRQVIHYQHLLEKSYPNVSKACKA